LPQKEREVYLLSRVEKKTYSDIAEITGIGVKAVERRMSKALLQLREVLGTELKF
ncbi:MAG: RNA polymerase subunit sigma-70, partial [Muricauda sp.]|nr:RNA polymerase subunit sigma-70 [Allomuricauda sp.]